MRGGGHKSAELTEAAGFADKRSYVRLDGKRFLFGEDIEQLRRQVFERDKYLCWGEREGERCGCPVTWWSGHMHHIQSRGKRGSDSLENLVTLCPACHAALHPRPRLRWCGAA